MIWFLIGAAVSLAALDWSGAGGSRRYWVTTASVLATFGLALSLQFPGNPAECPPGAGVNCRTGFLLLAGLFVLSSAVSGFGSLYRRLSAPSFGALALSDVCLILAVWVYHGQTSLWQLPSVGGWGTASLWGAAAALLRLMAPILVSGGPLQRFVFRSSEDGAKGDLKEAGLSWIAWWQGAFLAWWVGRPGAIVFVVAGLILWPAAAVSLRSAAGALGPAAGLVCVGAALSVPPAGLAATGLAGVALALGAPLVGLWGLAAFPLSPLTTAGPSSLVSGSALAAGEGWAGAWILVFTVLVAPAWACAAWGTRKAFSGGRPGISSFAGPAGLLVSLAAAGAAVAAFDRLDLLLWLLAGAGAAGAASWLLLTRAAGGSISFRLPPKAEASRKALPEGSQDAPSELPAGSLPEERGAPDGPEPAPAAGRLRAGAFMRTAPAWGLLLVAAILLGWLVSVGLQTEFL